MVGRGGGRGGEGVGAEVGAVVRAARHPSMCGPVSYPSIDTICDLSLLSGSFLYPERFFSGNFEFSLS